MKLPELINEAFTRNHLVISMHQSVGLEVRGTPRAFSKRTIVGEFCLSARRKA